MSRARGQCAALLAKRAHARGGQPISFLVSLDDPRLLLVLAVHAVLWTVVARGVCVHVARGVCVCVHARVWHALHGGCCCAVCVVGSPSPLMGVPGAARAAGLRNMFCGRRITAVESGVRSCFAIAVLLVSFLPAAHVSARAAAAAAAVGAAAAAAAAVHLRPAVPSLMRSARARPTRTCSPTGQHWLDAL